MVSTVNPSKTWNICLAHRPQYGGIFRAVNDFSEALAAPILSFEDCDVADPAPDPCCNIHRIYPEPYRGNMQWHLVPKKVAEQASQITGDADLLVVHSLFRGHTNWARSSALSNRQRYWSVPHGCLDPWGLSNRRILKRAWLSWYGRPFFERAECVVFSTAREMQKSKPWVSPERSAVVPWPVRALPAFNRNLNRSQFRERHGIPEAARLLIFVGRLHTMKRPRELLDSFMVSASPHVHLALIGMDGDISARELGIAIPSGWRNQIHITGSMDSEALGAAMHAADGFISLSFRENFGYAVADAAAVGLPLILSPGHDLAYEMPHDRGRFACGWLLPDNSLASAAQAIDEFSRARESELHAFGDLCRTWANDVLGFPRFKDRIRWLAARG